MWNSGAQVWMCMNIINLISGGSSEYSWRHCRTAGFRRNVLLFLILLFCFFHVMRVSVQFTSLRLGFSTVAWQCIYIQRVARPLFEKLDAVRIHKKKKKKKKKKKLCLSLCHPPQKQTGRRICILSAPILFADSRLRPGVCARAAEEYLSPGSYQARHIYFHYWQMTVAHPGCGID